MATPDFDAVNRYITRIREFIADKFTHRKMYAPTVSRLLSLRHQLIELVSLIDEIIPDEMRSSQTSDIVLTPKTLESLRSLIHSEIEAIQSSDVAESISAVNCIVQDKLQQRSEDHKDRKVKHTNKDTSYSKDVVIAYRDMFDASATFEYDNDVERETFRFLRLWFSKKILGVREMRKIDGNVSYNVSWIPQWIRDFVIYICHDTENVSETFTRLHDFLNADNTDVSYTKFVPYEVAELGIHKNRNTVTNEADELWIDMFNHIFSKLKLPETDDCYCGASLVSYAYLSEIQIENREWVLNGSSNAAREWLKITEVKMK